MRNSDQQHQHWQQQIEQRINNLEAENERITQKNEKLKAALETRQEHGQHVTRRQALGGLLGGGALLGMAGSASAQSSEKGGPPFADEDHDHSGDYLGEEKPVSRIDAGRINRTHYLDPGAKDWGKAVNNALTEMNDGEVLYVPPVEYRTKTKAVIDKDITIMGDASAYLGDQSRPMIVKDADIPILEAQDSSESKYGRGVQIRIIGLKFNSAVEDTTPGAIFHGTTEIKRVSGGNLGNHVILLQQRAGLADNMNNCLVKDVSGSRCDGSVVRIENVSDAAPNVNAQRIEVRNSFRNHGWGIDAEDGFGNYYSVQVLHGTPESDAISGGIRLNTRDSLGRIIYIEGDMDVGIQFDSINNTGEIVRGTGFSNPFAGKEFVDNTGQNRHINYGNASDPDIIKPDIPYTLSGGTTVNDGDIRVTDIGNGLVLPSPSGVTYRLTVDDDGNLTTEQTTDAFPVNQVSLSVDGDVSELGGVSGLGLSEEFVVYKGDPTVSGTVWVTYDSSYLYLAADLEDDIHSQPNTGPQTYTGDVIEFGVGAGKPGSTDTFSQIDVALTPDGPQVYQRVFPDGSSGLVGDAQVAIVRNDANHTIYEMGFPWEKLQAAPDDDVISLGATVTDRDENNDLSGLLQWGGGIFGGKDPSQLNQATLMGK